MPPLKLALMPSWHKQFAFILFVAMLPPLGLLFNKLE